MANRCVSLLTDRAAKAAKKTVAVGGVKGLTLRVQDLGDGRFSKSFILRTIFNERSATFTIGRYPDITLERARQIAQEWRTLIAEGKDPKAEVRLQKVKEKEERIQSQFEKRAHGVSLQQCMLAYCEFGENRLWMQQKVKGQKISRTHTEIVLGYMKNHIPQSLLNMPANDITAEILADVFKDKWIQMVDTPERIINEIRAALAYAERSGKILPLGSNAADLKGRLRDLLPPDHLRAKKGHRPALPPERIPELFVELQKHHGVASKLIQFSLLTANRATNARLVLWPEIHLDPQLDPNSPIQVTSRDEMKVKRVINFDRETPLSKEAIQVLQGVPRFLLNNPEFDFVFVKQTEKGCEPITPAAVTMLIKKINTDRRKRGLEPFVDPLIKRDGEPVSMSIHGTARASFKTWALDHVRFGHKPFTDLAIEHCLDHVTDKYNNAYLRRAVIGEMREIFDAWGAYCFSALAFHF